MEFVPQRIGTGVGDGLFTVSGFYQLAHASAVLEYSTVTLSHIASTYTLGPSFSFHLILYLGLLSAPSDLESRTLPAHKEVLVVLSFASIVYTLPSLEHSCPFLLQDSLNHWSMSTDPILVLKNDQPICHVFQRSSSSVRTAQIDGKEAAVAMKNPYFISHLGFCDQLISHLGFHGLRLLRSS